MAPAARERTGWTAAAVSLSPTRRNRTCCSLAAAVWPLQQSVLTHDRRRHHHIPPQRAESNRPGPLLPRRSRRSGDFGEIGRFRAGPGPGRPGPGGARRERRSRRRRRIVDGLKRFDFKGRFAVAPHLASRPSKDPERTGAIGHRFGVQISRTQSASAEAAITGDCVRTQSRNVRHIVHCCIGHRSPGRWSRLGPSRRESASRCDRAPVRSPSYPQRPNRTFGGNSVPVGGNSAPTSR
jgi:hypothetical protein